MNPDLQILRSKRRGREKRGCPFCGLELIETVVDMGFIFEDLGLEMEREKMERSEQHAGGARTDPLKRGGAGPWPLERGRSKNKTSKFVERGKNYFFLGPNILFLGQKIVGWKSVIRNGDWMLVNRNW